ncbi:MAG TPA: hypothetical protein VFZ37_15050 [Jiangellaceae bacterium]
MRATRLGVLATGFVAVVVTACGDVSNDMTSTPSGSGGGEVREIAARIVAEDIDAGVPWTTSRLTSPRELELLAPDGAADWDNEVVFAFTLAESGSCPFGAVERVEYSEPDERLYPVVPLAEDSEACTDDANPHTVVVAITRDDLPEGAFSIWVDADEPPSGVTDGVTRFAAGELDPGDQAAGEFEALGADGALAVGETRIAYDVTTHCGLNRIFRTIDGRQWVLNEGDASPENMDYVPEQWRGVVTGQAIDLQLEHAEPDVLLVTALGTEHTLRYLPAADELGCD